MFEHVGRPLQCLSIWGDLLLGCKPCAREKPQPHHKNQVSWACTPERLQAMCT